MHIRLWQHDDDFIVYDAEQIDGPSVSLFDTQWWDARGLRLSSFRGRGTVAVVRHGDAQWVLRHFRRGGLVGHLVDRSYVWTGLRFTRPWREWHLLARLHADGLPVPRPVAARVSRSGMRYHGDLLSELIVDSAPIAEWLKHESLSAESWREMGRTIRRFHDRGVHHPDLNARNILRRTDGRYFLVDFDRGRMHAGSALLESDLRRLRRSLDKHRAETHGFGFEESAWQALLEGYAG